MRAYFVMIVVAAGCSDRTPAGSGSGSSSNSIRPREELVLIAAGSYLAVDPVFSVSGDGSCSDDLIAKVMALGSQVPWPDRRQEVAAFSVDKQRVTSVDYLTCVSAGACPSDSWVTRDYRFARVTAKGASAYCRWRDAKLPTLLQWQASVRGVDGRLTADCDDKTTKHGCTITTSSGVVIADTTIGLAELTSTVGCWGDVNRLHGRPHVLMAAGRRIQLSLFAPVDETEHGEFRCAREQAAPR